MRRNNYQQSAISGNSYRLSAIGHRLKRFLTQANLPLNRQLITESERMERTDNQFCRLLRVFNLKKTFWLLLPLFMIVLFAVANWCFPLPKTRLHPPVSRIVLDRNGEWLRAFLADDGMWRMSRNDYQSSVES